MKKEGGNLTGELCISIEKLTRAGVYTYSPVRFPPLFMCISIKNLPRAGV